ncbi:MAG: hypothetical protein ABIM89_17225 [Mycobacteriales bacterium]
MIAAAVTGFDADITGKIESRSRGGDPASGSQVSECLVQHHDAAACGEDNKARCVVVLDPVLAQTSHVRHACRVHADLFGLSRSKLHSAAIVVHRAKYGRC